MKHKHLPRLKPHRAEAFTLIELLTVIVIISILVGLVIGISSYARQKAASTRAKSEIAAMETALQDYKIDTGSYPAGNGGSNSSASVYSALVGGSRKYMTFRPDSLRVTGTTTNIVDPFGTAYRYLKPGSNNPSSFDLWSFGPDGQSATAADKRDDLTNFGSN